MVEALPCEVFEKYKKDLSSNGMDANRALDKAYRELGVANFSINPVLTEKGQAYYYSSCVSAEGMLPYIGRLLEASIKAHDGQHLQGSTQGVSNQDTTHASSVDSVSSSRDVPVE